VKIEILYINIVKEIIIMHIKSVAVFCGSKTGKNPAFMEAAKYLGKILATNNISLIYGGGSVGMMGAIADSMIQYNGKVIGIIPEILVAWEQQHKNITELRVVEDMHIRKKMMYELCDAAIVMPGGYGTLDEMFEIITWNNLKIHEKKVVLLNIEGYYDPLIAHLEMMQAEGFLYENWKERIVLVNTVEAIFSF
jgi:uncharacterized protein (TIGR00730 family)